MEAIWLFGKREKETNQQEIFEEVLRQKKRLIRRIYRKKKNRFFQLKNSKNQAGIINPNMILKARKKKFYQTSNCEESQRFWKFFLDEASLEKMNKTVFQSEEEEQDSNSESEPDFPDSSEPQLTDMQKFFEQDEIDVDSLRADLEKLAPDDESEFYNLGKYE